ncbi:MAG: GNAT family N-acetyltransferase, partial [Chloroflexota bacterium]|nr:GNAT family N-acetyltransferase [Chloroflexota bacterium]
MIIEPLTQPLYAAWDAYVTDSPAGLPQHLSGWRAVLRQTYGYPTCYLLVRNPDGDSAPSIRGVLPLFFVRSLLTGHTAMTMPGGLCADDAAAADALLAQGEIVARQMGVQRLVIQDSRQAWPGDFHITSKHVSWVVDVRAGEEGLWQGLDRNIRRQIRMARDNGLRVEIARTPRLLADFYRVLSRFTHQSGTPIFARRFLEQVVEQFPAGYNIVMVYKDQQPIGGYFQLELGGTVYGVWGATLHEYLSLRPVYLAYWEILVDAATHGFQFLDMGRSPLDSNASAFKRQWGGVCQPIYQQVVGLVGQPVNSLNSQGPSAAKFRLFQQI